MRGWMRRNGRFVEGRGRGSHTSVVVGGGCGQEELGIIMRVKLATKSTVVEKTGNCPHESMASLSDRRYAP